MDMSLVQEEFIRLADAPRWRGAALHHTGGGLQDGAYLQPAKKYRRRLVDRGDYKPAALLECVCAAGLWTSSRCQAAGYHIDTVCPLCGEGPDTEEHRLWWCSKVREQQDHAISSTNHLAAFAKAIGDDGLSNASRCPAFWLRGLIPTSWMLPVPAPPQRIWTYGVFGNDQWNVHQRVVYVDESAGEFSSNPLLRRCGWGLVMLDSNLKLEGAVGGTLEGERQTQVAACLDAILYLIRHSSGDVIIKPDCNYAVEGMRSLLRGTLKQFCPHAHIWDQIRSALDGREGTVEVQKVDSHVDAQDYIDSGYEIADWIGNEAADTIAGDAACSNKVPLQLESDYELYSGRAGLVMRRAIAVHRLFMPEERQAAPRGVWIQGEHPVQAALAGSGHSLVKDRLGAFYCSKCRQRVGRRGFKAWLAAGPCQGHTQPLHGHD
jgi:ribonuclease HI